MYPDKDARRQRVRGSCARRDAEYGFAVNGDVRVDMKRVNYAGNHTQRPRPMHTFTELVDRCTTFTLYALSEAEKKLVEELQNSAATSLVKSLQMVQLQRAISAVGMYSMFEAILQDGLGCKDGFKEAKNILDRTGEISLKDRLSDLQLAINVLKHGRGRSYDELIAKSAELSFRIKQPGEHFFCEGDVSEVSTLIEVDDAFVRSCAEVISAVSVAIKKTHPEFFG